MASGDVHSVREGLKEKNLDEPVERAFRVMQIAQWKVRGSEAGKDNLRPKFLALSCVHITTSTLAYMCKAKHDHANGFPLNSGVSMT